MNIWELFDKLGSGYNGEVWSALKKGNEEKNVVAMKLAPKRPYGNEIFLKEVRIHAKLKHPFIVDCIDSFEVVESDSCEGLNSQVKQKRGLLEATPGSYTWNSSVRVAMSMEFIEGTNLEKLIKMIKRLSDPQLKKCVLNIGSALAYLKEKGILHQDVKPENVMYDYQKDSFKLIDFGFAVEISKNSIGESGTPYFMPPELLAQRRNFKPSLPQPFCAEVWAFGVTIYSARYGDVPWRAEKLEDLANETSRELSDERFPDVSDNFKSLLKNCLSVEVDKRISIENILIHPYVKEE